MHVSEINVTLRDGVQDGSDDGSDDDSESEAPAPEALARYLAIRRYTATGGASVTPGALSTGLKTSYGTVDGIFTALHNCRRFVWVGGAGWPTFYRSGNIFFYWLTQFLLLFVVAILFHYLMLFSV